MKNLLVLSLSMFILLSSFSPKNKGYKYESDEALYSVVFPASFTTEESQKETFKNIKVMASFNDINFMSTASLHETELTETDELELISLESFVESLNGKVSSQNPWSTKGAHGTKAIVILEESQTKLEYLILFKNNIQYQLVVFSSNADWNQETADKFFASAKFK